MSRHRLTLARLTVETDSLERPGRPTKAGRIYLHRRPPAFALPLALRFQLLEKSTPRSDMQRHINKTLITALEVRSALRSDIT